MAGNGEIAYTALVANVRLLPIDSDLAQTLRMGSEHFRRRYGVDVAAGTAPILRGVVELPGVAREADQWGGYVAVDETSDLVVGSCAFLQCTFGKQSNLSIFVADCEECGADYPAVT